ncbi:unnamed protein product [Calypogeia fissa]
MVKEELDRLLEAGIIYPMLNSQWVSPIVIVPKKVGTDGKPKIRICQDFRKLNDVTLKDFYPLPFTDIVLDIVAGHEVYSFLDGYLGYNQIWIKEDQAKTAFTTEWGIFAFRRMPFGLCNAPGYYQRFIQNYAKIALPLTEMLTGAPVLITPDWGKDFHVYVDCSGFCIGSVLSQLDTDGRDHPIYFTSRQLSALEKNYSGTDREALGVIYSCKKFRHYLLGYKVIFHTNHKSLKYMVNKPDLTGRIARWVLLLQEFNYKVAVRSGRSHSNADFFSRIGGDTDTSDVDDTFPDEDVFNIRVGLQTWYPEIIKFLNSARLP